MSELVINFDGRDLTVVYSDHGSDLTVDSVYDKAGNEIIYPMNSEPFLDLYSKVLDADREAQAEAADFLADRLAFL